MPTLYVYKRSCYIFMANVTRIFGNSDVSLAFHFTKYCLHENIVIHFLFPLGKMEVSFINSITELYKTKSWKDIVSKYHDHPERNKLLWVFPSEDNLQFLKRTLEMLECEDILSVGCGSGLLEWIISEATGFPVQGIEVDGDWWHCQYAPPTFIPLHFSEPTLDKDTIHILQNAKSTALLFCYFNNREAFEDYLKNFSGNVMVIMGPGEGKGVHTDPLPFGDIRSENWTLHSWREVRSSKDFIAIYVKSKVMKTSM